MESNLFNQDRFMPYAYSLTKDREEAKDLIQTAFLKVLTKGEYRGEKELYWLIKNIIHNEFVNQYRKNARYPHCKDFNLSEPNEENPYKDKELINYYIGLLPECLKPPVILYYKFDLKYSEISQFLDIPLGTVKSYLFRAHNIFKERVI